MHRNPRAKRRYRSETAHWPGSDCPPRPPARSAEPAYRRRALCRRRAPRRRNARWRAAKRNRRDRSTNGHRARRPAPAMSTAPPPASHAPAISRATAATRSRSSCPADGRIELQSSLCFVMLRDQPLQQANAKARTPALIDFGFRRAHGRARDIEVRPRRVVDEALQELRGGDRTAIAAAGIFHISKLRIDLLVVFRAERHAPDPFPGR